MSIREQIIYESAQSFMVSGWVPGAFMVIDDRKIEALT